MLKFTQGEAIAENYIEDEDSDHIINSFDGVMTQLDARLTGMEHLSKESTECWNNLHSKGGFWFEERELLVYMFFFL